MKRINVTQPSMPSYEEYIKMIKPLWDSHWLTNMGIYHQQLEQELKTYLEIGNISLTVNGHMALEMLIQAMNFPRGSEVITTPFTFVSTTHAIIRNGLVPIFCDIKISDYTINEDLIEGLITEKTVAIVPVHVYGNICNVEEIERIAKKYNLKVIYDAAHAFGEKYNGKSIASCGDASIFSFHATKVFHTIEGGAVCSNNKNICDKVYNIKNFGIRSEELVVDVGANGKMNEFQAIMGILNLQYINREIGKRKKIVENYRKWLGNIPNIKMHYDCSITQSNYAYFPILFMDKEGNETRDKIFDLFRKNSIFVRKYFYPITADQECFGKKYRNLELEKSRFCASRVLILPLYADLTIENQTRICEIFLKYLKENS